MVWIVFNGRDFSPFSVRINCVFYYFISPWCCFFQAFSSVRRLSTVVVLYFQHSYWNKRYGVITVTEMFQFRRHYLYRTVIHSVRSRLVCPDFCRYSQTKVLDDDVRSLCRSVNYTSTPDWENHLFIGLALSTVALSHWNRSSPNPFHRLEALCYIQIYALAYSIH